MSCDFLTKIQLFGGLTIKSKKEIINNKKDSVLTVFLRITSVHLPNQ